jgi:hypothetical protein
VAISEDNPHHTEEARAEKARLLARGYNAVIVLPGDWRDAFVLAGTTN